MAEVCSALGSCIQITVTSVQSPAAGPVGIQPVRSAFDVLMLNQKQLSIPSLPGHVNERTKKDKLFNDLVDLLENTGKKWHSCNISSGKSFLLPP